jgi:carboxyl-terminal processing protease
MPLLLRRSSGWITAAALAVLALALAGSVPAPASTTLLPPGAIAPTDNQRSTARRIGRILEEAHYSRAAIDDKMSDVVYQRFLEFLDGQRSYFLASDINDFNAYRFQFGDMIRTGNIDPAYLIFSRFQQRNRERIQHAIALLQTEPEWTLNESFDFDRMHAA